MGEVRFNMTLSRDLAAYVDDLARREDTTRAQIFRRALAMMKAFDQQRAAGRKHVGFTSDPGKLDVELVGILDHDPPSGKD